MNTSKLIYLTFLSRHFSGPSDAFYSSKIETVEWHLTQKKGQTISIGYGGSTEQILHKIN